jgi:hypothetical protein
MEQAALNPGSVRIVEVDGKFIVAVHRAGSWRQLTWHHRRADAQRDQGLLVMGGGLSKRGPQHHEDLVR